MIIDKLDTEKFDRAADFIEKELKLDFREKYYFHIAMLAKFMFENKIDFGLTLNDFMQIYGDLLRSFPTYIEGQIIRFKELK